MNFNGYFGINATYGNLKKYKKVKQKQDSKKSLSIGEIDSHQIF